MAKKCTPYLLALLGLLLAACSAGREAVPLFAPRPAMDTSMARIVTPAAPLQCVPFARETTGLAIRGNAWTWWRGAEGRYRRGGKPAVGSVLVWKRTARLRLGHLAVVTALVDNRTVLVDHANWLNRGRIHRNTPVMDVSPKNDWSAVRVWYTPGNTLGTRSYATRGFIYPKHVAVVP